MKQSLLTLVLFALLCTSCRSDKPPSISIICTLDGFGGGDCVLADGTRKFLLPSEMKNFWATSQNDEANFSAWCYKVSPKTAQAGLAQIKARIEGR